MANRWITLKVNRALYVSDGRDKILCDRGHSGPVTLVLNIEDDEFPEDRPPSGVNLIAAWAAAPPS